MPDNDKTADKTPELRKPTQKEVNAYYAQIMDAIRNGAEKAKAEGKPLLVLVGEEHKLRAGFAADHAMMYAHQLSILPNLSVENSKAALALFQDKNQLVPDSTDSFYYFIKEATARGIELKAGDPRYDEIFEKDKGGRLIYDWQKGFKRKEYQPINMLELRNEATADYFCSIKEHGNIGHHAGYQHLKGLNQLLGQDFTIVNLNMAATEVDKQIIINSVDWTLTNSTREDLELLTANKNIISIKFPEDKEYGNPTFEMLNREDQFRMLDLAAKHYAMTYDLPKLEKHDRSKWFSDDFHPTSAMQFMDGLRSWYNKVNIKLNHANAYPDYQHIPFNVGIEAISHIDQVLLNGSFKNELTNEENKLLEKTKYALQHYIQDAFDNKPAGNAFKAKKLEPLEATTGIKKITGFSIGPYGHQYNDLALLDRLEERIEKKLANPSHGDEIFKRELKQAASSILSAIEYMNQEKDVDRLYLGDFKYPSVNQSETKTEKKR